MSLAPFLMASRSISLTRVITGAAEQEVGADLAVQVVVLAVVLGKCRWQIIGVAEVESTPPNFLIEPPAWGVVDQREIWVGIVPVSRLLDAFRPPAD